MNLPAGSTLLPVLSVASMDDNYLALLNSVGRLLIIPLSEVPVLTKGKGNILMKCHSSISDKPVHLIATVILKPGEMLLLSDAKQTHSLDFKKWQNYIGKRGQTGKTLSKPLTSVKQLSIAD